MERLQWRRNKVRELSSQGRSQPEITTRCKSVWVQLAKTLYSLFLRSSQKNYLQVYDVCSKLLRLLSMPQKYLHYFGNESNASLLEAYGMVTKDQRPSDALKPKQCPNCMEPNKPDSKFCAKCRMVLTYDAYSGTIEEKKQKESEVRELKYKYEQDMKAMRQEIREEMKEQLAQLVTQLKPEVIREGLS
jgi:hypothetical protein